MRRTIFCYSAITVLMLTGIILWHNHQVVADDSASLGLIRDRAKELFSLINISGYKFGSSIYNEQGELIRVEEVFAVLPDKVRSEIFDCQNREIYTYIVNGNAHWSNKPCLPFGAFVSQLFPVLAGKSVVGEILEEESELSELNGKKCFAITFLFGRIRIKGYLDYSSFSWLKIEAFYPVQEKFMKATEIYPEGLSDIDNLMIPMSASGYVYFSSSKRQKRNLNILPIKTNLVVKDSNFIIPE